MAVKLFGFGWNSNDKHVPWKMFCKAAFFNLFQSIMNIKQNNYYEKFAEKN